MHVIDHKGYANHRMYKNISSDISDDFIEIVACIKEVCKLIRDVSDKYGVYNNACVRKVIIADPHYRPAQKYDARSSYLTGTWKYAYDFNIDAPIRTFAEIPVIEIILSTLCFRLKAKKNATFYKQKEENLNRIPSIYSQKKDCDEMDSPTRTALDIIDRAIQIFERTLFKLRNFRDGPTSIGNFISPKYRKYIDLFGTIYKKEKTSKGYAYNLVRNCSQKTNVILPYDPQIFHIDIKSASTQIETELELDLNVAIIIPPVRNYVINVAKINDHRLEICETHASLSEIDQMLSINMDSTVLLLVVDNKLVKKVLFIERNIHIDVQKKYDGKYNLLCVNYIICSDKDVIFEKILINKNVYDVFSCDTDENFSKFDIMGYNYINVVDGVVIYDRVLINKSSFDNINFGKSYYRFTPMLWKIRGNKFKMIDVLIHSTILKNIANDTYHLIHMKPVITLSTYVYYEYALIIFPIDSHLINVNMIDPTTFISTNVILDECTYFKLCESK